jgi:anti-sigma-K factor RskA
MTELFHVFDMTAPYALESLSPEERLTVQEHVATCEPCRTELAEMQRIAGMLPLACEAAKPDDEAKRRLLAAVDAELKAKSMLRRRSRVRSRAEEAERRGASLWRSPQNWLTGLVAAAAVAAVFVAMDEAHERERLAQALAQATVRVADLETTNERLSARAQQGHDVMAALATGSYWEMGRSADPSGRSWRATVVQPMDASKNAMIMATVPDAPKGMSYQMWVVHAGKPHSAGTIRKGGMTIMDLPMPLAKGDLVAFSMEHGAGSTSPSTPYLMQTAI